METKTKIAFCFLTYDIIIRYDIWNRFFENIDKEKYIVYIHPKNPKNIEQYTFEYNIVKNRVNTSSKDNISIVKATLQLLKEAYNKNNNISHFVFLSQSCIPLYSFNLLFKIISSFPYSVISSIDNNKKDRYFQLGNELKTRISYKKFVKQQPNMILTNVDVSLLINNDLTNYFSNMICPDEHYFINVLDSIFNKNIIKKQINFCNNKMERTQALEFNNVYNIFIKEVRKYGFLFMRKITKTSTVNVDFLLTS